MALLRSAINIEFTAGDYNSTNRDANGFWLTMGTYTSTTSVELNQTTIDVSSLTLRHNFTGTQFTNFTLFVYLRVGFRLNGAATTYRYLFGDAGGDSIGQKSMTGGTTTLLSAADTDPVIVPHNADGSRPDLFIQGYCDSTSTASFVPASTTANTALIPMDKVPIGKTYDNGFYKNSDFHLRYNGTHWVETSNRLRYNGTHWVNTIGG
jgi:hypothetical protein